MKRHERRLCLNLNQLGDTWRDMERRQDELADYQLEIEEFETFNREALDLYNYEPWWKNLKTYGHVTKKWKLFIWKMIPLPNLT